MIREQSPCARRTVLKSFDEDWTIHSFALGASNFGSGSRCFVFSCHICMAELRTDGALFWRDGRNRGLVCRCRVTNDKWRVESFIVCTCKRRRAGPIRRSKHSQLFHAADGLHQERQRSAPELNFFRQRDLLSRGPQKLSAGSHVQRHDLLPSY